jgi:hypothetical protein
LDEIGRDEMKFLRDRLSIALLCGAAALIGCAKIPPEAPALSQELGNRITAIQTANINLLHRFFDFKRKEIDRFVHDEWLPVFAEKLFADPRTQAMWTQVVASQDPKDRVEFIRRLGPPVQAQLDAKRQEIVTPLEELEREVELKIRAEYEQAHAINNSLTSLLLSASQVEENRKRYLEKIGITDDKIDQAVNSVHETVNDLLAKTKDVEEKTKAAQEFLEKMKKLKDQLRSSTASAPSSN